MPTTSRVASYVAQDKKNEQAYIESFNQESFNQTVRKECLGWGRYSAADLPRFAGAAETFLERYHYHWPHLGLGLRTPLTKGARLSDIYGEYKGHLTAVASRDRMVPIEGLGR